MKRLLAYLFLVLGLGLIFSGTTFAATEKDSPSWGINVFNPETESSTSEPKILNEEEEKKILESRRGLYALCLNENDLNKVKLTWFYNIFEYKKHGSFINGECNYAVDEFLNPELFNFIKTYLLKKKKFEIEKKYLDAFIDWLNVIYFVTQDGTMVEVFSLVNFEDPSLTGKRVKKVTKKKFIDLIFCAQKNGERAIVASTKSKNHTMIGSNISEGKCGGKVPKKISYQTWKKDSSKRKICVSSKIEESDSAGYGYSGSHALMTPKKETCEFFNRYEAKYDRESKRFYYEVLEVSQTQEVAEKSDKKKKKWKGKPFSKKKLVSFILNNAITIDYDGKKETYIFKKIRSSSNVDEKRWKFEYEVREGINLVGKGTWVFDKMATSEREKKDRYGNTYEKDLSKFANLNKKLSKNSIKLLGDRKFYLQVYKKLDRVSTYVWVPRQYEDPEKDKKDDQINREIVDIAPIEDFEKKFETIRLVKLASREGKKIAEEKRLAEEKRIAKEKRLEEERRIAEKERKKQEKILAQQKKEEEKRKKELLLAQKEEDEKKKQELLLAQKKAEEERKKQELLLAQKKAEEEKKKQELLLSQKKAEEEKRLAEEKRIADVKKEEEKRLAEEKKKLAEKPKEEFKPEDKEIDNDPPVILIAEAITVNDYSYEIEGKITDQSDKVFIEVDGRPVRVKKGKFKVKRFSPVDEQISIIAIDQWGNKSEPKFVKIIIDIQDTEIVEKLEPLDPSNIKSKSNKNRVALIIGIEKYEQAPAASFANLDAQYFYEYARNGFGVSKSNMTLLVDEDASLIKSLGIIKKWLPGKIKKNETELIIFFAGHGLASNDGKELYILSQDSDPDLLARTALSRTEFFEEIINLNPKSVTMFMDTCYSGVSRDEEILLATARPVRIIAGEQQNIPDNFTIFTASQLDQISSGLKEANHGIFSYYLMKGLEGEADTNKDKQITNGEMLAYMDQNVSQKASELGRKQNPSLAGDPDKVLMSY